MAVQKKRRRVNRNRRPFMLLILFMFVVAFGYIIYVAVSQPERLAVGLFGRPENAPVNANASEPNSEASENEITSDAVSQYEVSGNEPDGQNDNATSDMTQDTQDITAENPTDNANSGTDTAEPDNTIDIGEPSNPDAADTAYAMFAFYEEDKLSEYIAYQNEHPSYKAEDVVWMVNAGLNRPFFTDAEVITEANPLLVNPYNRLPDDFEPAQLEYIDDHGRLATRDTINAFQKMREGANAVGYDIAVQSAYRTIEYQRNLYERAGRDGSVARPNYSEHHTGRALDLWGPDGLLDEVTPSDTGRWVAEHAHEYGFIVRYTAENQAITSYIPEPWHITYVGEKIAREIHDGQYSSLEEYVVKNPGARLP